MQRYSPDFIQNRMTLGERASRVLNGKPFPGYIPTRMYISIHCRDGGKKTTFFSYNGKRSNSAYQQALRVKVKLTLSGVRFTEVLIEYTPNVTIYVGDLTVGTRGAGFAAYYPSFAITDRLAVVNYPQQRQTVIRFRDRSFYFPSSDIPDVAAERDWERLRTALTMRMRSLRG